MSKNTSSETTGEVEPSRGTSAPAVWIVVTASAVFGVIAIVGTVV